VSSKTSLNAKKNNAMMIFTESNDQTTNLPIIGWRNRRSNTTQAEPYTVRRAVAIHNFYKIYKMTSILKNIDF
jgi:hypothetical protein